jgi:hypothetical protein
LQANKKWGEEERKDCSGSESHFPQETKEGKGYAGSENNFSLR